MTTGAEPIEDETAHLTPECRCADCRDSDEAGCAVVMHSIEGERVQCGMQGRHDGSCDYWEKPHDER